MTCAGDRKGFTLIEMILAGVLLSLAVLTLGSACTRFLNGTQLNREYEAALSVADRQLVLINYIGVEVFIEAGVTEGEIEDSQPVYRWSADCQQQDVGNLYKVSVTVSWVSRNRSHSVTVDTLTNGTGAAIGEVTG